MRRVTRMSCKVYDVATDREVAVRAVGSKAIVVLDAKAEWYDESKLIAMHDMSYRQPTTGTVVAVGPRAAVGLAVGDRVYFGKYNGLRLHHLAGPDGRMVYSMDANYTAKKADGSPHVPDIYWAFEREAE